MSPEQTVNDTLRLATGVTALVGSRIYPDSAPEKTQTPYIVYTRLSTDPVYSLNNTPIAEQAFMQATCWAQTRIDAETVANAAQAALLAAQLPISGRSADFDPDTEQEGVVLDFDIWL